MNAMDTLSASLNPEDVERRHRAYLEARQPLVRAMVNIIAVATPAYCVIVHSDGSWVDLRPHDDGLTPEMRQQMEWLRDQDKALARSFGFHGDEEAAPQIAIDSHAK